MKTFDEKLRALMAVRKINQRDLANVAGISQATVNGYANGRYSPRLSHIIAFTRILKCKLEDLLPELEYEDEECAA